MSENINKWIENSGWMLYKNEKVNFSFKKAGKWMIFVDVKKQKELMQKVEDFFRNENVINCCKTNDLNTNIPYGNLPFIFYIDQDEFDEKNVLAAGKRIKKFFEIENKISFKTDLQTQGFEEGRWKYKV